MPAILEINLNNLKSNITKIKKHINCNGNNKNIDILAMIKADAYGAGMIEVAKLLEKENIKYFGVAYLKEAKLLREKGIGENIIVFSGLIPSEIKEAVKLDAIYATSNLQILEMLDKEAKVLNKKVKVHIPIDTGMGRVGVLPKDITSFSEKILNLTNIEIDGVFSHFSSADTDSNYTIKQNNIFNECIREFEKLGITFNHIHICNSIGTLEYSSSYNNMIRLGIGMYGYIKNNIIDLKGTFKLIAPICDIRVIPKGEAIGYNKTYVTNKETKIATVQIGYADGLSRKLSNNFSVIINSKEAKILGNICMDMTMIDVTEIPNVKVGDYVTIFDYTDNKLNEIARKCNTINYETISTIGKRVDRIYVND